MYIYTVFPAGIQKRQFITGRRQFQYWQGHVCEFTQSCVVIV